MRHLQLRAEGLHPCYCFHVASSCSVQLGTLCLGNVATHKWSGFSHTTQQSRQSLRDILMGQLELDDSSWILSSQVILGCGKLAFKTNHRGYTHTCMQVHTRMYTHSYMHTHMHPHDRPEPLSGILLTEMKDRSQLKDFPQNPEAKDQKIRSVVLASATECARELEEQTQ